NTKQKLLVRLLSTLIPDTLLRNAPNVEISVRVTGKVVLTIVELVVLIYIVTLMPLVTLLKRVYLA
ncbi:hypothetical protein EO92_10405, partial [Methanosarcina sp. 2.H.A.1B.4]